LLKVYCERGAYRTELRSMERDGLIQLLHFPYEGHNRRIRTRATPSVVTWDTTYVTLNEILDSADVMVGSEKFSQIRMIIGANEFDARHLDSAYKSRCDCFLTPDKRDIADKSVQLESLLGLKIFHAESQWDEFIAYVTSHQPQQT
jgi:hypothetical protein